MKQIEVVAAVIQQGKRVLATQRASGEFKGFWEFPGGKPEKGESLEEALIREIQEELGVLIAVKSYIHTIHYDYPDFHLVMHTYFCSILKGKPVLLEHSAAKWFLKEELKEIQWIPADINLLQYLNF